MKGKMKKLLLWSTLLIFGLFVTLAVSPALVALAVGDIGIVRTIDLEGQSGTLTVIAVGNGQANVGKTIRFEDEEVTAKGIDVGDQVSFEFAADDLAIRLELVNEGQVVSTDVDGNLTVGPDEVVTVLGAAQINGNIDVAGGTVVITEASTVNGNVRGDCDIIIMDGQPVIDGNITADGAGGDNTLVAVAGALVNGNIETMGINTVIITGNDIDGNVTSDSDGNVTVTDNDPVTGNLTIIKPTGTCTEANNNVGGTNTGCPP